MKYIFIKCILIFCIRGCLSVKEVEKEKEGERERKREEGNGRWGDFLNYESFLYM